MNQNDPMAAARNLFIRRWGEMGASWGISRTMAELHALLFVSARPLCTDDVMELLAISRGNASMNLRQLVNWGLIERVHQRGDRREYFVAETDVWQMFETIVRERRRREVEPILETINRCLETIDDGKGRSAEGDEAKAFRKRLVDILEFCQSMNVVFNMFSGRTGVKTLARAMGNGKRGKGGQPVL